MDCSRNDPFIDWTEYEEEEYTLIPRLARAFLNNHWRSDISFYVPKEDLIIPAHSLIVATASPILEKICFDSGELTAHKVIAIPDEYSLEDLGVVLTYIYFGTSVDKIYLLENQNLCNLLNLSEYFGLSEMADICIKYLKKTLNPENVCSRFDQLHNHPFGATCLHLMQSNMSTILADGSAMDMSDAALTKLLNLNRLTIQSEQELIEPLLKWSLRELERQGTENNAANVRAVLKTRLGLIRFTNMSPDTFGEQLDVIGHVLTDSEISAIVKHISTKSQLYKKYPVSIGTNIISDVPRQFMKTTTETKTISFGYMGNNLEIVECIPAPYPNTRTWLTGLKFGASYLPTMTIIDENTHSIIHKNTQGDNPKIVFAKRLPLDFETNGQWKLKLIKRHYSDNAIIPMLTRAYLVPSEQNTCIESITIEFEKIQPIFDGE